MEIIINSQSYQFDDNSSLAKVISNLDMEDAGIAIALNEQIIPKSEWEQTHLSKDDKIIIIGAVAGG